MQIKKWCELKRGVYRKRCETSTLCRRKWSIGRIILKRQKYCRKACPRATLCITNPAWTGLGLNPVLHINSLVIKCPRFSSRRKALCSLEHMKFDVFTVACWNVTLFSLVEKCRPNKGSLTHHFCVGSDLWQMLRAQGYQLDLLPYSEWYQKVKEAAGSVTEHSKILTSLLYLLDAFVVYVSLATTTHITCNHIVSNLM